MAKHWVKCYYCGERFDANSEEYVMVNTRRYAHKKCSEETETSLTQEQLDKIALDEYIQKLFNIEYVEPQMQKQIKRFIEQEHFTYSGIKKALIYFFEVKGNSVTKAGHTLGIVPWVYESARRYYFELWQAQQRNDTYKIKEYQPKIKEIVIPVPEVKRKTKKFFSFLDQEELNK